MNFGDIRSYLSVDREEVSIEVVRELKALRKRMRVARYEQEILPYLESKIAPDVKVVGGAIDFACIRGYIRTLPALYKCHLFYSTDILHPLYRPFKDNIHSIAFQTSISNAGDEVWNEVLSLKSCTSVYYPAYAFYEDETQRAMRQISSLRESTNIKEVYLPTGNLLNLDGVQPLESSVGIYTHILRINR